MDSDAYSEPYQTFKMERFAKIVNGEKSLTISAKRTILDVWHGSEYPSDSDHKKVIHFNFAKPRSWLNISKIVWLKKTSIWDYLRKILFSFWQILETGSCFNC